jgi:hypothetical protein
MLGLYWTSRHKKAQHLLGFADFLRFCGMYKWRRESLFFIVINASLLLSKNNKNYFINQRVS